MLISHASEDDKINFYGPCPRPLVANGLRRDFFHLLDNVTGRSEKLGFQKEKNLSDITVKLLVFGVIGNH